MNTKINIFSRYTTLIYAAAMAVLGFSCTDEPECMYGTPTGSFEIKEKVTDADGNAEEGATMRAAAPEMPSDSDIRDEGTAPATKNFTLKKKTEDR